MLPIRFLLVMLASISSATATPAPQLYRAPRFADSDREARIRAVLPELDQLFVAFAAERRTPGLVWGVVVDGRLVHSGATGHANLEKKIAAGVDTRFRMASMTKSFTALAVLKLRDAGKLGLDEPAVKYIPELRHTAPLTADAPPITVRHLMTMTAGFPEDNPWGDRQLADTVEELKGFFRNGYSASNAPGVDFEYSNFGYALLGEIISNVAGEPYQRYITREILGPLGMKDTCWEFSEVPPGQLALGYRWRQNTWQPEPLLADGTYGAMGGLLTTLADFARYVSFHLAAWPARDEPELGPVRRATVREMHKPAEISSVLADAKTLSGEPNPQAVGYGYGMRWVTDSRNIVRVGHSGGLPGFGSNYQFLPDCGVAVISFANVTYAGTAVVNNKAIALLLEKARLPRRSVPATPLLEQRKEQVAELIRTWDASLAAEVVAENFFLDRPREDWIELTRETIARAGAIKGAGPLVPENQLRGTFPLQTEKGRIDVFFTLTPEKNPRVQQLRMTFVAK